MNYPFFHSLLFTFNFSPLKVSEITVFSLFTFNLLLFAELKKRRLTTVNFERHHSINIGRFKLLFGKTDIFASHYERALGHKVMIICTLGCQICQYLSCSLIYKALSGVKVFCFEKKYWHEKLERAMDCERALGQNRGHIRS